MLPKPQGLYDPQFEHDSCGVGFIADIQGESSHEIVRRGLQIMLNLEHRGAVGADPLAGDGAGHPDAAPARPLRRGLRPARYRAAGRGRVRRGHGVPAHRWRGAPRVRGDRRTLRRRRRPARAGLARRAGRQFDAERRRPGDRAGRAPGLRRPRRRRRRGRRLRAQALRHPQAHRERGRGQRARRPRRFLHLLPVGADDRLQGHADGLADRRLLRRFSPTGARPARWRSSTSAFRPTPSPHGGWPTPTA